jgi:ankyrin repeat protein
LIDIVRFFIEKNIDVICKDKYGRNALHLVCIGYKNENFIDIVRLLIEKNIDVNCKDDYDGWNALNFVSCYAPKTLTFDLVQLLVQHKIDKKVKTTGTIGKIGTARSFLLSRFKKEEIADVLQMLDS